MRPDQTHITHETAARLTKPQRAALLLLHRTEPVRQSSSGIPGSTFRALRTKGLARHGVGEAEWFLTDEGFPVQQVVRVEEGYRVGEE